jgi:hypothetical protein
MSVGKRLPNEGTNRETTLYVSSVGIGCAYGFDVEVTAPNKTPRREDGGAKVMGGFPKEKQKFYTKFMPLLLAPPV